VRRTAFGLMELLVVIAILALLVAIIIPLTGASREQARVVKACAELRNIGLAMEAYTNQHRGRTPPGRTYCDSQKADEWSDLPEELVQQRWLPAGSPDGRISSAVEDVFNPDHTYKYMAPGWGYHNGGVVPKGLWIPDDFPRDDANADPKTLPGKVYDNVSRPAPARGQPKPSPVKWVVWSLGPRYDAKEGSPLHAPIPRSSWYHGLGTRGVIPRIGPADGEQIAWR
jgi:type II secretory pathway pseudopilin PulG